MGTWILRELSDDQVLLGEYSINSFRYLESNTSLFCVQSFIPVAKVGKEVVTDICRVLDLTYVGKWTWSLSHVKESTILR